MTPKTKKYSSKTRVIIILLLLYLTTRIFSIIEFAPHNDEVNYAWFSQLINADWEVNKYISMDGRMWGEYKDPLQYWLGTLFVNMFEDPLIGLRVCSLMFGFMGISFMYLLAKEVFQNRTIAQIFLVLVIFSDYFFMMDSLFLAEVYVYGLGSAFLYFTLLTIKGFWKGKLKWQLPLLAIISLVLCLLSKQSGTIWIAVAFVIFGLFLVSKDLNCFRNLKKIVYSTVLITLAKHI